MTSESLTGTGRAAPLPAAWREATRVLVKRLSDVVVASLLVLALGPVMLAAAAAVKLSSPGPVLFRQERVGLGGASFRLLKFRSMHVDCDDAVHRQYVTRLLSEDAPPDGGEVGVYKLVDDARITKAGRFLRRSSIDELPQLFNVLHGEMSLVGPRPALDWEVALYEPRHRQRMSVKPGLTGLWQVSGRSAMSMRDALDLDVQYAERRSLALDVLILLRTPWAVLRSVAR